jgi:hypothetical protein
LIRWLIVIVVALIVFNGLRPLLEKIGLGRLPGDFRFMWRGREWSLPIASTVLLSFIAMAIGHFI